MKNLNDKLQKRLEALQNGRKLEVSQPKEQNKEQKSLADRIAKRQTTIRTLSQEVEELVQKISDRGASILTKINNNLYVTEMPTITYDILIVILNNQLKVYEDVLEGDLKFFEKLTELEQEWRRTKSPGREAEFFYDLRKLQDKYKSLFEEEPALAYLKGLAGEDER